MLVMTILHSTVRLTLPTPCFRETVELSKSVRKSFRQAGLAVTRSVTQAPCFLQYQRADHSTPSIMAVVAMRVLCRRAMCKVLSVPFDVFAKDLRRLWSDSPVFTLIVSPTVVGAQVEVGWSCEPARDKKARRPSSHHSLLRNLQLRSTHEVHSKQACEAGVERFLPPS